MLGLPLLLPLHNVCVTLAQAAAPGLVVATPGLAAAVWLYVRAQALLGLGTLALAAAGGLGAAAGGAAQPLPSVAGSAAGAAGYARLARLTLAALELGSVLLLGALWASFSTQVFGLRWIVDILFA